MARKILRLRISGRVQGVGFRAFVTDEAETRGLAGWVRNRADGNVEAVIAGDESIVDDMLEACSRGPLGARVENVAMEPANESELGAGSGFAILRTM
jgi:acylphosphatase